jgi:hypothetical protein
MFVSPRSPLIALAIGLAFGVYMTLADTTVFATAVPAFQHEEIATTPAITRVAVFVWVALKAEIVLRLVLMTVIVAMLQGTEKPGDWCYWAAILFVAAVAYPIYDSRYFAALTWTPLGAARELALHFTATVLWGWLYWRHGFLAAVTGHCAAQLTLQPLLTLLV